MQSVWAHLHLNLKGSETGSEQTSMSQTTQPRTVAQDLKLIRKAIRRIAKHPDANRTHVLREIQELARNEWINSLIV